MKKLLCLLFAAFLLCVSASALELPSGLDDVVPRELIDSAEAGDELLLRGGQYLFSHFRAALQDAVANSLRGAMALMLLSLLCGLVESTAESAGETPARYAGYLGVLGAAALSAGDLSALIGLGVETMDELSTMAKLLLPTIAAAMAGGGCVGSASVWQVGEHRREQQKKRERFVALLEKRRHGAHAQAQRRKLDKQLHPKIRTGS